MQAISKPMDKKELQKHVDAMKEPLLEYWTNELHLPLQIQLKSMALMDLYVHELVGP